MRGFLIYVFLIVSLAVQVNAQDHYRRGDLYFESMQYSMALREYENALSNRPNDMYALTKAARCNVYLGNLEKANVYLSRIESKSPFLTIEFLRTRGEYFQQNYQFQEAITYYKKADPNGVVFRDTNKKIHECEVGKKLCKKPKNVKIQNMGPTVNSVNHDVLPKITADFGLLYFTSHREGSVGGSRNPEDVYLTAHTGSEWIEPIHLPMPLNSELNEACVGLSQDGQTMFLFRGNNKGDLYVSSLEGSEWSKPVPFQHNSAERESSVCVSPNGRELFFVRQVGGVSNIYSCDLLEGGLWSEPRLLPGLVNSDYDEASPYIHPDGVTLYFSSKGHDSMGGFDIFKSELVDGKWTKPENMGAPINTPGDDMNFVLSASGEFGFYSSVRRGGYGGQDLYLVGMAKAEQDKSLTLLKGKVTDAVSGKAIQAEIWIIDNEKGVEVARFKSNSETGNYLVALPAGKDYGVRIEKEGHVFYSENVFLKKGDDFLSIINNVKLSPSKQGEMFTLRNIFFKSGKFDLETRSFPELDRLVALMVENESMKIEVVGHTDNVGKALDNEVLSEQRAKEVTAYLVSKGISSERLQSKGYGSNQPIVSNDSIEGRSQNRRTEIIILEE